MNVTNEATFILHSVGKDSRSVEFYFSVILLNLLIRDSMRLNMFLIN